MRWLLGNVVVMLPTPAVCGRNYNSQMPPQHLWSPWANQRLWRPGLTGNVHLVSLVRLGGGLFIESVFPSSASALKFWSRSHPSGIAAFQSRTFLSTVSCGERGAEVPHTFWWVTKARIWRSRSEFRVEGQPEARQTGKGCTLLLPLASAV